MVDNNLFNLKYEDFGYLWIIILLVLTFLYDLQCN